jgi:hypothetical protein
MKMRTLRRLRTLAPRRIEKIRALDVSEEPDPGPAPERIFDRSTGPWNPHRAVAMPGAADEET